MRTCPKKTEPARAVRAHQAEDRVPVVKKARRPIPRVRVQDAVVEAPDRVKARAAAEAKAAVRAAVAAKIAEMERRCILAFG